LTGFVFVFDLLSLLSLSIFLDDVNFTGIDCDYLFFELILLAFSPSQLNIIFLVKVDNIISLIFSTSKVFHFFFKLSKSQSYDIIFSSFFSLSTSEIPDIIDCETVDWIALISLNWLLERFTSSFVIIKKYFYSLFFHLIIFSFFLT
jgi:hypothetical protein